MNTEKVITAVIVGAATALAGVLADELTQPTKRK